MKSTIEFSVISTNLLKKTLRSNVIFYYIVKSWDLNLQRHSAPTLPTTTTVEATIIFSTQTPFLESKDLLLMPLMIKIASNLHIPMTTNKLMEPNSKNLSIDIILVSQLSKLLMAILKIKTKMCVITIYSTPKTKSITIIDSSQSTDTF